MTTDSKIEWTGSATGSRLHRRRLSRTWGRGPLLGWVMLNPSTADADVDDPTVRRCVGFASRLGYSGIVVRNLFSLRATNPADLRGRARGVLVGPGNDDPAGDLYDVDEVGLVVAGWGASGDRWPDRVAEVVAGHERTLWCLGTTASGQPRHPLYLPSDAELAEWRMP